MSLTDILKAGRLQPGRYWIKNLRGGIMPDVYMANGEWIYSRNEYVEEVLDSCDYEELQQLKLKKELAANTADSYAEENEQLRTLLKECRKTIETQKIFFAPEFECVKCDYNGILTRIEAHLGEEK